MKTFKNYIAMLLIVLMISQLFVSAMPVMAIDEADELPPNAIPINNVDQLAMICNEYPANGYYYLTGDIDMSYAVGEYGRYYNDGKGWEALGNSSTPFTGTFDGQGKTISGLNINRADESYAGLFGYASGAVIKNITIDSCSITAKDYVGAVVGYACNSSVLTDCNVVSGEVTGKTYIGGIAGYLSLADNSTVANCNNGATISANGYGNAGGIAAHVTGTDVTVYNCHNTGSITNNGSTGGIAAVCGYVNSCTNTGNIRCSESYRAYVGGIAGSASDVENCINRGSVYSSRKHFSESSSFPAGATSDSYTGGIVGLSSATVKTSFNTGSISFYGSYYSYRYHVSTPTGGYMSNRSSPLKVYGGGICGKATNVSQCYNTGTTYWSVGSDSSNTYAFGGALVYTANVENCYSENSNKPLVGASGCTIKNCYSTSGIIAKSAAIAENCFYYSNTASGVGGHRTLRQLRVKDTFEGWDFDSVWTMEGNGDYLYPELQAIPSEFIKTLSSVSVCAPPNKTYYMEGTGVLDLTGAKLSLNYDNDTYEEIDITEDMISPFDNNAVGTQYITVTYNGFSDTFSVLVLSKTLISIEIKTLPQKLQYTEGKDELDVKGGEIALIYDNGTTEIIPMTPGMIHGFDNTVIGEQILTVSYYGMTTSFPISVCIERRLESISIQSLPRKVFYLVGEDLDCRGLALTLSYNDGTTETITDGYTFSGFDSETVGEKTVTVTYNGLSCEFKVEVDDITLGDINEDGVISAMDANLAKRLVSGAYTATAQQIKCADMNGDGVFNSLDTNILARMIAGSN